MVNVRTTAEPAARPDQAPARLRTHQLKQRDVVVGAAVAAEIARGARGRIPPGDVAAEWNAKPAGYALRKRAALKAGAGASGSSGNSDA